MNMRRPVTLAVADASVAGLRDTEWRPALDGAGLYIAGVWSPPTTTDAARARATTLAAYLDAPLDTSPHPRADGAGVITCAHGEHRRAVLAAAATRPVPVLLDAPIIEPTSDLEALLTEFSTVPVVAGHAVRHHPSFTRAVTAVRNAEIGLLRAVALDLVVAAPAFDVTRADVTGAEVTADETGTTLRVLGGAVVDALRILTGPATSRLQAHHTTGRSWAWLAQTDRDVVVSAHLSQVDSDRAPRGLLASARLVGTHGSLVVDLTRPALDLRTADGTHQLPYGADSVSALVEHFGAVIRGDQRPTPAADLLTVAHALDTIADSAATTQTRTVTW